MMTYEQALAAAKDLKPSIDYCVEHQNAFMFGTDSERYSIGGDGPVFIMKQDGKALGSTAYYDTVATEVVRKEFKI